MSVRRITTAWVFHCVCSVVAVFATPARAQVAARWQTTTASTWASGGLCAASGESVGESLRSSQAIGGSVAFGERRALSAVVDATGAIAAGRPLCGQRSSTLLSGQASYRAHDTRVWVAYSRSQGIAPDTIVRLPGLSAGVERRLGSTIVAMSVGPRRDRTASQRVIEWTPHLNPEVIFPTGSPAVQETTFVADTVTRLGRREISDVGLALSWTRKALGVEGGVHFGLANALRHVDPLATLRVTYGVTPRLSAIAAVTSRSAVRSRDLPATQIVTLGVRITGSHRVGEGRGTSTAIAAAEFRATRDTADRLMIAILAPRAERVEIAGDFTQWAPLNLERHRGGWWQLRVHTPLGTHRVSMRVDGGRWLAPPGLVPVHDEFGGTVGMLVVQ